MGKFPYLAPGMTVLRNSEKLNRKIRDLFNCVCLNGVTVRIDELDDSECNMLGQSFKNH